MFQVRNPRHHPLEVNQSRNLVETVGSLLLEMILVCSHLKKVNSEYFQSHHEDNWEVFRINQRGNQTCQLILWVLYQQGDLEEEVLHAEIISILVGNFRLKTAVQPFLYFSCLPATIKKSICIKKQKQKQKQKSYVPFPPFVFLHFFRCQSGKIRISWKI